MPSIIPANIWEPLPDDFETGFAPDNNGRQITTEEIIAAMDDVAKSIPIQERDLLKRREE